MEAKRIHGDKKNRYYDSIKSSGFIWENVEVNDSGLHKLTGKFKNEKAWRYYVADLNDEAKTSKKIADYKRDILNEITIKLSDQKMRKVHD